MVILKKKYILIEELRSPTYYQLISWYILFNLNTLDFIVLNKGFL